MMDRTFLELHQLYQDLFMDPRVASLTSRWDAVAITVVTSSRRPVRKVTQEGVHRPQVNSECSALFLKHSNLTFYHGSRFSFFMTESNTSVNTAVCYMLHFSLF